MGGDGECSEMSGTQSEKTSSAESQQKRARPLLSARHPHTEPSPAGSVLGRGAIINGALRSRATEITLLDERSDPQTGPSDFPVS